MGLKCEFSPSLVDFVVVIVIVGEDHFVALKEMGEEEIDNEKPFEFIF